MDQINEKDKIMNISASTEENAIGEEQAVFGGAGAKDYNQSEICEADNEDKYGCISLHYGDKYGNYQYLNYLLEARTDCCIPVDDPMYETHYAKGMGTTARHDDSCNHVKCIEELMRFGAECGAFDAIGNTPLHIAVANKNIERVKELVHAGFDVNCINNKGFSPLHLLFRPHSSDYCAIAMEILEILLQSYNTDVNQTTGCGLTALHLAVIYSHWKYVEALIRYGADCSAVDALGNTPLHIAVENKKFECIKKLVHAGSDLSCINNKIFSPLHLLFSSYTSCYDSDFGMEILKIFMLEGYNTNVNQINGNGETVLHLAVQHDLVEYVKVLIQYGADCSAVDDTGDTPLHIAVKDKRVKCVKELVHAGSDVNCINNKGFSPLHLLFWSVGICYDMDCNNNKGFTLHFLFDSDSSCHACDLGMEILKILLLEGYNTDVNQATSSGLTALHLAVECNLVNYVKVLIQFGADCSAVDETGNTPLHIAVKKKRLKCVKELVHAGSDVSCINSKGFSPLHLLFCSDGYSYKSDIGMKILEILVLEGYNTDVNQTTSSGLTALNLSALIASEFMMTFLVKYGADVNIKMGNITLLEYELNKLTGRNFINYFTKCMPQLPRLKSLNIYSFQKVKEDKENFVRANAVCHDLVLPDNVKFNFVQTDAQVYVEIYSYEVRPVPDDVDRLRFQSFPSPVRYPLQQPVLNLVYERVMNEIEYSKTYQRSSTRHHSSPFNSSFCCFSLNRLKNQLWYEQMASTPLTLKHFCRYSIRKRMGPSNLKHIRKLPLPECLLSYLLFEQDE